jgi:type VI secretion system protein ImpL
MAARAARALEQKMAKQAKEQAKAAEPKNRAEIEALERHFFEGIEALKRSALGQRAGASALYALPWYVMVGPPGAGKTTALRRSGLPFPYEEPTGLRGVGGTQNCDWWFTSDAVLIDTAGRYTTDAEDREEWLAFLGMLRKYRKRMPINGVIVAVGIDALADASADALEQMGSTIRARIEEMQRTLNVVLPVYVLFTKCDLLDGFVECFGELTKSQRAQAWGATLPSDLGGAQPAEVFRTEMDTLVSRLHTFVLRRLGTFRAASVNAKIFHFPLEIAALKDDLALFIGALFPPGRAGAAPEADGSLFRGFYFTSGTQEGRPITRVINALARAFGLTVEHPTQEPTEQRSYFLHDVFTTVVFPDQRLATRTPDAVKKERLARLAVIAAGWAAALALIIPVSVSFAKNQGLIAAARSAAAANMGFQRPAQSLDELDAMCPILEHLERFHEEGPPLSYRWGMYQGDRLLAGLSPAYVRAIRDMYMARSTIELEARLARTSSDPERFRDQIDAVRTYLLLGDRERLSEDIAGQASRLAALWTAVSGAGEGALSSELRQRFLRHATLYTALVARGLAPLEKINAARAKDAGGMLADVCVRDRLKSLGALPQELAVALAKGGGESPSGLASISTRELFAGRPNASMLGPGRIRRLYTRATRESIVKSLPDWERALVDQLWIAPLGGRCGSSPMQIPKELEAIQADYNEHYVQAWRAFVKDSAISAPRSRASLGNVTALLDILAPTSSYDLYQPLFEAVDEHTRPLAKELLPAPGEDPPAPDPDPIAAAFSGLRELYGAGKGKTSPALVAYGAKIAALSERLKVMSRRTDLDDAARRAEVVRVWSEEKTLDEARSFIRGRDEKGKERDAMTQELLDKLLWDPLFNAYTSSTAGEGP